MVFDNNFGNSHNYCYSKAVSEPHCSADWISVPDLFMAALHLFILLTALSFSLCSWCMWTHLCRTVISVLNFQLDWWNCSFLWSFLIVHVSVLLFTQAVLLYICFSLSSWVLKDVCIVCCISFPVLFSITVLLFLFHPSQFSVPWSDLFFILLSFTYFFPFYPSTVLWFHIHSMNLKF